MDDKKIILIKCGGSIINSNTELHILLESISLLKQSGCHIVIVHGGGPDITELCEQLNVPATFINGQRVTSSATLEVTQMALLGKVNCNLVYQLNLANVAALGLSGHDLNLISADFINQAEMGYVGKVVEVNHKLIYTLLNLGITPVIAPLGVDKQGNSYNINADLAAAAIAAAIRADKFVLLSDIDGFYQDINDKTSVVAKLSLSQVQAMLADNKVQGGMIPKLTACSEAIAAGVASAHIINGNSPHGLMSIVRDNATIGTTIIKDVAL